MGRSRPTVGREWRTNGKQSAFGPPVNFQTEEQTGPAPSSIVSMFSWRFLGERLLSCRIPWCYELNPEEPFGIKKRSCLLKVVGSFARSYNVNALVRWSSRQNSASGTYFGVSLPTWRVGDPLRFDSLMPTDCRYSFESVNEVWWDIVELIRTAAPPRCLPSGWLAIRRSREFYRWTANRSASQTARCHGAILRQ